MDPINFPPLSYPMSQRTTLQLYRPLVHVYLISVNPSPTLFQYALDIIKEITDMGVDVYFLDKFQQNRLKMENLNAVFKRSIFQSHIIIKDTYELTKDVSYFINDKETRVKFFKKKNEIYNVLPHYFDIISPVQNYNLDYFIKDITGFSLDRLSNIVQTTNPLQIHIIEDCLNKYQLVLNKIRSFPELSPGRQVEQFKRPEFTDLPQSVFDPSFKKHLLSYIEQNYSNVQYYLSNKQIYFCNQCGGMINPSVGFCMNCRDQLVSNVQYEYPPYSPLSQYSQSASPPPPVELGETSLNPNAKPFIPKRYSTPNRSNGTTYSMEYQRSYEHPCRLCGEEGKLQCKECPIIPPFEHTYYCSIKCQRDDWAEHQKRHHRIGES